MDLSHRISPIYSYNESEVNTQEYGKIEHTIHGTRKLFFGLPLYLFLLLSVYLCAFFSRMYFIYNMYYYILSVSKKNWETFLNIRICKYNIHFCLKALTLTIFKRQRKPTKFTQASNEKRARKLDDSMKNARRLRTIE